ncbi:MAG: tagatose 1,6-diphosphate aldolase [Chloroflexota bacterium]
MTSLGKYRHLAQASTPAGHFVILAIDHRGNLRASLDRHAPAPLTDAEFAAFKLEVIAQLGAACSAVLADPGFGLGPAIARGALSGQQGFLAPIEITNYDVPPDQRGVAFIPGWSVEKIKRAGGAGVKLLLFYHPAAPDAAAKREAVSRIIEDCARWDIPFFLEPIVFSPDPARALTHDERRAAVVSNAREFSALGIDVLKTEFPLDVKQEPDEAVWRAALDELNAACAVPWALLSAGVDYATFERQAELACAAGASGVIVGRAVWAEAATLSGVARAEFLRTTGPQRMTRLAEIAARHATDWRRKVAPPAHDPRWYEAYPGFGG